MLQPSNARKIVNICCCQLLKNVKRFPRPAELVSTPFSVRTEAEACKGCGLCVERCPMGALWVSNKKVAVDADRCI